MFELVVTLCAGWASGVLTGSPGACQNSYLEVVQDGRGRPTVFRTFEACDREYRRQVYLGQRSYVYIGLIFDKRVYVNRVLGGTCRRIN
jgi:hypothetical protein